MDSCCSLAVIPCPDEAGDTVRSWCLALGFAEILMFPGTCLIPGLGEPADPKLVVSLENVAGG